MKHFALLFVASVAAACGTYREQPLSGDAAVVFDADGPEVVDDDRVGPSHEPVSTSDCGSVRPTCGSRASQDVADVAAEDEPTSPDESVLAPPGCAPGATRCGEACVETATSVAHCGACGVACSASHGTPACGAGRCAIACEPGWGDCDGDAQTGCEVDLGTSPSGCGACGRRCGAAEVCQGGSCACGPGLTRCGDVCVDARTSAEHCGACGRRCSAANGSPSCAAGACQITCASGYANCDGDASNGCEVATGSNADHCGACGRVCAAPAGGTRACVSGGCAATCPAGFIRCGTTCVDARSPCSVGVGACRRTGSVVCAGSSGACGVTSGSPGAEVCNGVDDNCDGAVDNVGGSCTNAANGCGGTYACAGGARVCTSNQRCPLGWSATTGACAMPAASATLYSNNWKAPADGAIVAAYRLPLYTSASGAARVTFALRVSQAPSNCGTDGTPTAVVSCNGRFQMFVTAAHFAVGSRFNFNCGAGELMEVRKNVCSCDTSPFAGACNRQIYIESVTNGSQPPACLSSYGSSVTRQ